MNDWYQIPKELILKEMQVPEGGLSSRTAESILAQVGENTLTEQTREKAWQVSCHSSRICWW